MGTTLRVGDIVRHVLSGEKMVILTIGQQQDSTYITCRRLVKDGGYTSTAFYDVELRKEDN